MNQNGRSRVFVTQENTSLNYTTAEQFGDITFMSRDDYSPIKNSLSNEKLLAELQRHLKSFDIERDYIVVTGSPIVAAAVFLLLGRFGYAHRVNVLRWSNRDHTYQPITIDITGVNS